ncbi:MAG: (d)CMP kinase [Phycisphaeraceae bacterium]|nr:(d)CMP kinase [Phycisphaeraceae bacterium]
MRPTRLIVTIDGPAGTGKTSVGRALARRLGLKFLDTGAMYRAAAAIGLDEGIVTREGEGPVRIRDAALVEAVARADLHFDWQADPPALHAFGRPIMGRIRDKDVTAVVSPVSTIPALRHFMVQEQLQIAAAHPLLLTEGRDQGRFVFPDAEVKFFLEASVQVRARRRAEELRAAGRTVDEGAVFRDIQDRDLRDKSRIDNPMVPATDAVLVDTSNLTFDQVLDRLELLVHARTGTASAGSHH